MKAMYKDILREIFKSKTRFFSIFLITLLAVMTFIGLNVSSIYQQNTLDNLYKTYNSYDIQIKSNIAFSNELISKLNNLAYVSEIEYVYEKDIYLKDSYKTVKIKSMPKNISKLNIIEGEFLDFGNNILLENKYKDKYKIGDKIILDDKSELRISGFYENIENRLIDAKDISYIGYGVSNLTVYISESYFENQKFNIANIKIKNVKDFKTYEEKYFKTLWAIKNDLKKILKEDEQTLVQFKRNVQKNIDKKHKLLKDSENIILTNKKKLENAQKEYKQNYKKLISKEKEFNQAQEKFKLAFKQIEDNLTKLKYAKEEVLKNELTLNKALKKINSGLKEIQNNKNKINEAIKTIEENKKKVHSLKPTIFLSKKKIDSFKQQIISSEKEVYENKKKLSQEEQKVKLKQEELNIAFSKLEKSKNDIKSNLDKLNIKKEELLLKEKDYYINFDKNKKEIISSKEKLKEAKIKLDSSIKKFDKTNKKAMIEIKENYNTLENAQRELESVKSIFLVGDRNDNLSFRSFNEGINSLKIISKLFPIIFYCIVILVITTTLTRMVDEQRNSIGTYKFIGYSNFSIVIKYVIYGLIPTIFGILLGVYGGTYIFPKIIYKGFSAGSISSYDDLIITLNFKYIIISIIISILSTLISISLALKNELNSNVANILKEKAPKNGQSILLEKIGFLWNRLNFFNKITLRNIFRYKVRMILNILGIAGCTSLIFFSFAIKNSLTGITDIQFNKLHKYNLELNLKPYLTKNEIVGYLSTINKENIYPLMKINAKFKMYNKKENNISVYILDDLKKFNNFINLVDKDNKKINFDNNGVLISERALKLMNKNIGDNILIHDILLNKINLKVANTFKNYFSHYIFMTKEYYESLNLDEFKINSILLDQDNTNYELILLSNKIQNINLTNNYIKVFDKVSNSLNSIILFIVSLSAILSIVVTYSLLDINVNERKKELATIKVLGFYHNEVIMYIFKEVLIMSIIGILIGFLGGNALTKMVINSLNKTDTVLLESFKISPYIYSSLLTLIFSLISMILIQFNLKKIDMVQALKSD